MLFPDGELESENIEEFTLYAGNVIASEDTGAQRPVCVLERGVVEVLGSHNEGTEEHTVVSPF